MGKRFDEVFAGEEGLLDSWQPGESFKPMTMTTTNTMVLIRLVIVD